MGLLESKGMNIIIFDIDCVVYNSFIENIDNKNNIFLYASLNDLVLINSKLNTKILNINQIVVFDYGSIYYGGNAIKYLLKIFYPNSFIFKLILWTPNYIVNIVYRIIAHNRYLFGYTKSCNLNFSIKNKLITDANIAYHIHNS